ncbi:hypothetical protein NBRC116493_03480 [Aurantivibrio infirmus]
MPVSFLFENNGQGVVVTAAGELLDGEFSSVSAKIYRPVVLSKLKYQVVDLTNVDSVNTTPEQIQQLAAKSVAAAKDSGGLAMAIIVNNGLLESLVRLWRFYAEHDALQVAVFAELESAKIWVQDISETIS